MKKIVLILVFGLICFNLAAATIYIAKTNGEIIEVVTENIKLVHFSDDKVALSQLITSPRHLDWLSTADTQPRQVELRAVLRDGKNQPLVGKEVIFTADLGQPLTGDYQAISDENGEITLQWEFYPYECAPPGISAPGTDVSTITAHVVGEEMAVSASVLLNRY